MHWMIMLENELKDYVSNLGFNKFRGTQLFEGIHKQNKTLDEMSNIPNDLIEALPAPLNSLMIEKVYASKIDNTKKLLYRLSDGEIIEGVLMEYEHGYSLCVSTQVGCRMGCRFCASTVNGLIRQLSAYEMLSQVYRVEEYFNIDIANVILMGSGEPFDNYNQVIRFLKVLHEPKGKYMGYRHMTISTCGLPQAIIKLSKEDMPVTLAVSLHQSDQKARESIMPIAKRYQLEELFHALKVYSKQTNQRITFEYTLIDGENDTMTDVRQLKDLTQGLKCHFNLIPLNPTDKFSGKKPDKKRIYAFQDALSKAGINATIRRELGSDIQASCGQLKAGYQNSIKGVIK